MGQEPFGLILQGTKEEIALSYDKFNAQPIDLDYSAAQPDPPQLFENTTVTAQSVSGPGTFFGKARRTLTCAPSERRGWWFERCDLPKDLPTKVSIRNVWTTARNIVLRSGSPDNYMRMVEHIIALRLGMQVDNLVVKVESGDPPLFDRGSMELVESLEKAGLQATSHPVKWFTVSEPVTAGGPNGSFLMILPATEPVLSIDCAIDFPNAIGKQRLSFVLNREIFRKGALARTNTTTGMTLFCHTIGKLFADTRSLGYTENNILIAGKNKYLNQPKMLHEGKSLEAVWHRAMLDLLAALALVEDGRFAGKVISYKAGHTLDVDLVRMLYKHNLLRPL